MYFTWGSLLLMVLAVGVVWFWQDSLRVRDAANAAAMEACTRMGLQFLDGTVAFSRLRLIRDQGVLRLRRTYVFDYTANSIGRLQGFAVLLGDEVETVGFARTPAAPTIDSYPPTPTQPPIAFTGARPALTLVESGARDPETTAADASASDSKADSGKILDLDEWRKKHQRLH